MILLLGMREDIHAPTDRSITHNNSYVIVRMGYIALSFAESVVLIGSVINMMFRLVQQKNVHKMKKMRDWSSSFEFFDF